MRVKVEISPHLPLGNEQQKIWLLVPDHLKLVGDLAYLIQETASLRESCPFGVVLAVDGFVLPHTQSIHIVRDNDTILVTRRTEDEQTPDKKKKRKHNAEKETQPSSLDLVVNTPTPKSEVKKKAKSTPKEEKTPSKTPTSLTAAKETSVIKIATPAAVAKASVPVPVSTPTPASVTVLAPASQTKSESTEAEEESGDDEAPSVLASKSPAAAVDSGKALEKLTRKQKKQLKKAKAAEEKARRALENASKTSPKPAANTTPKTTPINAEKKGNQTPKDKPATPSTKGVQPPTTPAQKKPVEAPQKNVTEKADSNKMVVDSSKVETKPKPPPVPQPKPQTPIVQTYQQAAPWGRQIVPAKHQRFIGGEDDELENISFFYGPQPRNYSNFPSLSGEPKVGDLVAYKVLELTAAKSPEVSSYKEAIVIQYDSRTKSITVQPKGSWSPRPPTDEELSEYLSFFGNDPSFQSTIAFEDMMEVLLLERQ